ncbi:MAG: HEAT repeat domain-containing protein, partial [Planctomycetota bacterium]
PSDATIHTTVVPLLLERLGSTRDLDLLASCLLSLGKIGEPPADLAAAQDLTSIADAILPHLGQANQGVRDLAVLSLGLLGEGRHVPLLASIALDEGDERRALKSRSIDRRTRSFAAYALGHIGATTTRRSERALVVHELLRLADEERDDADMLAAAVISLGWSPLPFEPRALDDDAETSDKLGREKAIELLSEILDDPRADERGRAQIPVAIARLILFDSPTGDADEAADVSRLREHLRTAAIERFAAAIAKRGGARQPGIREGAAQALGLLVADRREGVDAKAREALLALASEGQDGEAGLGLVALGRLAGRAAPGSATSNELGTALRTTAVQGPAMRRPWALLALGVAADRAAAAGTPPQYGTRALVAKRLVDAPPPSERSAAAISLGLASADEAKEALMKGLDSGDFWARGLHALGLARMGADAAVPPLRDIVAVDIYRPYLLRDAATALALLGDDLLVDLLTFRLAIARFMPQRVAALLAFAWTDDPSSIEALLFVLREDRMSRRSIDDASRAFAATALGALCGRTALPWNTRIALDVTWSVAPPSLTNRRGGGGVLDVL